jgi:hypothetical protein
MRAAILAGGSSVRPIRLWWPTIAAPWPLCDQLPEVWSSLGGNARMYWDWAALSTPPWGPV